MQRLAQASINLDETRIHWEPLLVASGGWLNGNVCLERSAWNKDKCRWNDLHLCGVGGERNRAFGRLDRVLCRETNLSA